MSHRKPPMPRMHGQPKHHCRWCAEPVLGPDGQPHKRRSWHPECVGFYRVGNFSDDQRRALRKRDNGHCAACGVDARSFIGWAADHIRPLWSAPREMALGDREAWFGLSNLQTLCTPCHAAKTKREAAERALAKRLADLLTGLAA